MRDGGGDDFDLLYIERIKLSPRRAIKVLFLIKRVIFPLLEIDKFLREFWCGGVGDTFCSQVFLKMRERSERHFLKKLVSKGKPPTCVWRALVMIFPCHI